MTRYNFLRFVYIIFALGIVLVSAFDSAAAAAAVNTDEDSANANNNNLRGGSGDNQQQEKPFAAFFAGFIDAVGGLIKSITSGPSVDVDGDGTDETIAPSIDSSSRAVQLEPQQLKDAGKIATIVGGNDAGGDEAPFFVMMLTYSADNDLWEYNGCGGTLLSDRHVLTAGHCAEGRDVNLDAVYVHAYQPFLGNPGIEFHYSKVESYTTHPAFDNGPNDSDVAIVTMITPIKDTSQFPPVQLAPPSLKLDDGDMVNVYGFGRKSYSDESRVDTLQRVSIPFISRPSCQQYYGSKVLVDMFCAGYEDGGKDACGGDSGGPLIVTSGNNVYQAGVVSWGNKCAADSQPGVYTSTQFHYNWIQKTVCNVPDVKASNSLCSKSVKTASKRCNGFSDGETCWFGGQCCSKTCALASGTSDYVCTPNYPEDRSIAAPSTESSPTAAVDPPALAPTETPPESPTTYPTPAPVRTTGGKKKDRSVGGRMGTRRRHRRK